MRGRVTDINRDVGTACISTEDGSYTVLEVLDAACEAGDELAWLGQYPMGRDTILNVTRQQNIAVSFVGHGIPEIEVPGMMALPPTQVWSDRRVARSKE